MHKDFFNIFPDIGILLICHRKEKAFFLVLDLREKYSYNFISLLVLKHPYNPVCPSVVGWFVGCLVGRLVCFS